MQTFYFLADPMCAADAEKSHFFADHEGQCTSADPRERRGLLRDRRLWSNCQDRSIVGRRRLLFWWL